MDEEIMRSWDDIESELTKGFANLRGVTYTDVFSKHPIPTISINASYGQTTSAAKRFVANLKRTVEENPVVVLAAAAAVISASAKLITAIGQAKGSRAYAQQVAYRIAKGK